MKTKLVCRNDSLEQGPLAVVDRRRIPSRSNCHQTGSALVIVLVLLGVMAVLMVSSSIAIYQLRQELKMVEQRQIKRLEGNSQQP